MSNKIESSAAVVIKFSELKRGDHIAFGRTLGQYDHHAIIVRVSSTEIEIIEFNHTTEGSSWYEWLTGKRKLRIQKTTMTKEELEKKIEEGRVFVYRYNELDSKLKFPVEKGDAPDIVIKRAESVLNADVPWDEYNVVTNNCEHFAHWCKTGVKRSKQVETAIAIALSSLTPQ